MAEYIPFDPQVEVNGETILSYVNALPSYHNVMQSVLFRYGIKQPVPGKWYRQKDWLNAFREIGVKYGPYTLFLIGKAIPKNAQFPQGMKTLKEALEGIDIAYRMNHRKGEIGYYRLAQINNEERLAVMECLNPYPSYFDMGIIISIARMYKNCSTDVINIHRDETKPSRLQGADSCTYILKW